MAAYYKCTGSDGPSIYENECTQICFWPRPPVTCNISA